MANIAGQTVYIVHMSWYNDGEDGFEFSLWDTIEAARAELQERKLADQATGISEGFDETRSVMRCIDDKGTWETVEEPSDWEITDKQDHYYAHSDSENKTMDIQIFEQKIRY